MSAYPTYGNHRSVGLVEDCTLLFRDVGSLAPRSVSGRGKRAPRSTGTSGGHTHAQQAGLNYERRVKRYFESKGYSVAWDVGFEFCAPPIRSKAWPDMFLLDKVQNIACVIEIKLTHGADAFWQLELYRKCLAKASLGSFDVRTLEITAGYRPEIQIPLKRELIDEKDIFSKQSDVHRVLLLTPKTLRLAGV